MVGTGHQQRERSPLAGARTSHSRRCWRSNRDSAKRRGAQDGGQPSRRDSVDSVTRTRAPEPTPPTAASWCSARTPHRRSPGRPCRSRWGRRRDLDTVVRPAIDPARPKRRRRVLGPEPAAARLDLQTLQRSADRTGATLERGGRRRPGRRPAGASTSRAGRREALPAAATSCAPSTRCGPFPPPAREPPRRRGGDGSALGQLGEGADSRSRNGIAIGGYRRRGHDETCGGVDPLRAGSALLTPRVLLATTTARGRRGQALAEQRWVRRRCRPPMAAWRGRDDGPPRQRAGQQGDPGGDVAEPSSRQPPGAGTDRSGGVLRQQLVGGARGLPALSTTGASPQRQASARGRPRPAQPYIGAVREAPRQRRADLA